MPLLLAFGDDNLAAMSTAGKDEVNLHYLEWQSSQVTQDSTYTVWPDTQSKVSVIDDQSSYSRNYYPDFKWETDGINITVPGKDIFECEGAYTGAPPENMTYDFGYGKLSAGHIDATLGDKTFGTLG